jgi:hypothetical protein
MADIPLIRPIQPEPAYRFGGYKLRQMETDTCHLIFTYRQCEM